MDYYALTNEEFQFLDRYMQPVIRKPKTVRDLCDSGTF